MPLIETELDFSFDINKKINLHQEVYQSIRDMGDKISKLSASKGSDKSNDDNVVHISGLPYKSHLFRRRGNKITNFVMQQKQEQTQKKNLILKQ